MSLSARKSPTKINPLEDNDFSEQTKKEIVYWSRRLKITPSELFNMPRPKLEKLLKEALMKTDNNVQAANKYDLEKIEKLTQIQKKLQESGGNTTRLKGGACRSILEILANAANEIEAMYSSGECDMSGGSGYNNTYDLTRSYDNSRAYDASRSYDTSRSYEDSYDTSNSCPFPTDMTYTFSEEEPTFESTFEDSFNIGSEYASTPQERRQYAANTTYNTSRRPCPANTTYDASEPEYASTPLEARGQYAPNATYGTPRRPCPSNSYGIPGATENVAFNLTTSLQNLSVEAARSPGRPCPGSGSYRMPKNSTYDKSNMEAGSGWTPQPWSFMSDEESPSYGVSGSYSQPLYNSPVASLNMQPPSFKNFTDYSLKFGPDGTNENATSITVESFGDKSGVVNASLQSSTSPSPISNEIFVTPPTGVSMRRSPSPTKCLPSAAQYPQTPRRPRPAQRYKPRRLINEMGQVCTP